MSGTGDYISREGAMDVCERPPITQGIKAGEKSICWSCFHWEVCFAKKNQPCIKCTRYIPAADVRPVVLCRDCRHRDPEDHKCDSGEMERQGCPFKVTDDYFCAYGER